MSEAERMPASEPGDRRIGHVTVLFGESGGRYPDGNSLLIVGSEETALVDPALSVVGRRARLPRVDRVLLSHCHEDHVAACHLFRDVPWHVHEMEAPGVRSLDALMDAYGFGGYPDVRRRFREIVLRDFHYCPRPDPQPLGDGDVIDLGGVRVTVLHAPGHTPGHCFLHVEPDDVLFLADVDLSSFGPYYGDAASSVEQFRRTLHALRARSARHYATFHHLGVLDEGDAYRERLDRYAAVIERRERELLAYLAEPRTVDEIVAHRFVYRPGDDVIFATPVERNSMSQHLRALLRDGRASEVEPGRYRTAGQ